jgi:hypothetical protein
VFQLTTGIQLTCGHLPHNPAGPAPAASRFCSYLSPYLGPALELVCSQEYKFSIFSVFSTLPPSCSHHHKFKNSIQTCRTHQLPESVVLPQVLPSLTCRVRSVRASPDPSTSVPLLVLVLGRSRTSRVSNCCCKNGKYIQFPNFWGCPAGCWPEQMLTTNSFHPRTSTRSMEEIRRTRLCHPRGFRTGSRSSCRNYTCS